MRAVDTNVLVRLFVRDDEQQVRAGEAFIANGAWVPLLVVAETIWVLDSVYDLKPAQIAEALDQLLNHQTLTLQDSEVITAALTQYRKKPALGFSDCLIVEIARKAGHLPVGTFERGLAKIDGVRKL
jgi:predicted nucleic-acid-binding protein